MKALGIVFLIVIVATNTYGAEVVQSAKKLFSDEKAGVRYYKKGKYKHAYEKLAVPAEQGLKSAQYYLGFMYLKGEHVNQSLETGMAWLGVACEIEVEEWRATFSQVYNAASAQQRKAIDERVSLYIELYGMKAQEIDCNRKSKLGSRKIGVSCHKYPRANAPDDNEFFLPG